MDKLTIKLTFTEFDNPELIDHLTAIESARHRARALRRLAEIGLAAQRMGLRLPPSGLLEASAPSVRATHAQATRAPTTPKPVRESFEHVAIPSTPPLAPLPAPTPAPAPPSISAVVAADHQWADRQPTCRTRSKQVPRPDYPRPRSSISTTR
ncbi:hypothetical protein [Cupriavidus sp. D39]|uniref:hypothetical protein n=1 Tax=Cupriavidus sp. D39 TaxID=2997877 RepID=UPI00226F285E|nr:hypothetical protein [Cupriavidus sp. D39]MCY0854240.1 hypothetical protein [Cupriavidus sp. D39]